jgi:hypothetical protein
MTSAGRHKGSLGLQVIVLQQTLLDDQIAVVALGREPQSNLDKAPIQLRWPWFFDCWLTQISDNHAGLRAGTTFDTSKLPGELISCFVGYRESNVPDKESSRRRISNEYSDNL